MNKYLSICGTSFRQESKTLTNSLASIVPFCIMIYIFYELWQFIYGNGGGGKVINGYTVEMMILYLITAEVLMFAIHAKSVTRNFGNDIKSGKICYQLNKPYNFLGYQICSQIGTTVWKLLFLLPTSIIMALVLLGPMDTFRIAYVLPMLISLLLATFLTCLIYGMLGLLAFWIEEATPFTWIIQKFQMVFGLFFPPEFFPAWLQPLIEYSPIYAMMSGPCKLVANFSWELFLKVSISQIAYITLFFGLCALLYKLGTKKVNINGG